jgi:hypothetical protein
MRFPIIEGEKDHFPSRPRCPQCKKRKVFEPHSMAILSGGAMLMDRRRKNGGPDKRMDGFLRLDWHGAHDSGVGHDREIGGSIELVRDCRGGQFEMYFCSTPCLRAFLNSCVDALEEAVSRERDKRAKFGPEYESSSTKAIAKRLGLDSTARRRDRPRSGIGSPKGEI